MTALTQFEAKIRPAMARRTDYENIEAHIDELQFSSFLNKVKCGAAGFRCGSANHCLGPSQRKATDWIASNVTAYSNLVHARTLWPPVSKRHAVFDWFLQNEFEKGFAGPTSSPEHSPREFAEAWRSQPRPNLTPATFAAGGSEEANIFEDMLALTPT